MTTHLQLTAESDASVHGARHRLLVDPYVRSCLAMSLLAAMSVALPAPRVAAQQHLQTGTTQIRLSSDDPLLEESGRCRQFWAECGFSGTLHLWAESGDVDPFLRVLSAEGSTLGQDDDSGCGTTAYLALNVEPGTRLQILAGAREVQEAGSIRLHAIEAPETEATRHAAKLARGDLEKVIALHESGRMKEASQELDSGLARLLATPGADSSESCANATAMFAEWAGRLFKVRKQREALEIALRHRERCLPPTHFGIHYFRVGIGATYIPFREYERARQWMEPALEQVFRCAPEGSHEPYRLALTFAGLLKFTADLEGAHRTLAKCARELTSALGPEDPWVMAARFELSNISGLLGDVWTSLVLMEEVDAINQRTLEPDDPRRWISRINLGKCLTDVGDFGRAQELIEGCLSQAPSDSGPHSSLASLVESLAILQMHNGQFEEARTSFEQALELMDAAVAMDSSERLRIQSSLAMALLELGLKEEASALIEQCGTELEPLLRSDSIGLGMLRHNRAVVRVAAGQLDEALVLLRAALTPMQGGGLRGHPECWRILATTAWVHRWQGDLPRAAEVMREALEGPLAAMPEWTTSMSARELESRVLAASWIVSSGISFTLGLQRDAHSEDIARRAFLAAESLRNASLQYASLERSLAGDPEATALRASIARASASLATLSREEASTEKIAEARTARDHLQRTLALKARGTSVDVAGGDVLRIESRMFAPSPGEVLISYHRFQDRSIPGPRSPAYGSGDKFCAFVLDAVGELSLVDLGSAREIERLALAWRDALQDPAEVQAGAGEALRLRIIDPLLEAIGDARRWIVVPDDVLALVPFDALPRGTSLLGDDLEVSTRLSTLRLPETGPATDSAMSLLAVGGVDYDAGASQGTSSVSGVPAAAAVEASATSLSADAMQPQARFRGTAWERGFSALPFTEKEVLAIVKVHVSAVQEGASSAQLLTGSNATVAHVRERAEAARYIHLATHGWGLPVMLPSTASFRSELSDEAGHGMNLMSPMLMSGLALAAANQPADAAGQTRGLLTAEELATWNLNGCELAVLSACETGLGAYRPGQGVASLQKALHLAGARNVIGSLWKVPDAATQELMLGFYRRLWIEGLPIHRALWETKHELRSKRRPAIEWAGWVLTELAE